MVNFSDINIVNKKTFLIANGLIKKTKKLKIDLDDENLANSHILISGGSGSGKTTLLKKMIDSFKESDKVIIIIDFHGDMYIDGENLVEFTPTDSPNAINPFELETDPKKGGVNIQAEAITLMLGTYFFDKGRITKKQENTLEKLIIDTYGCRGIFQDDKESWTKEPPTMKDLYRVFRYILSSGNYIEDSILSLEKKETIENLHKIAAVLRSIKNKESENFLDSLKDIENYIQEHIQDIDSNQDTNDFTYQNIDLNYYRQKSNYKSLENLFSYIEKVSNLSIFSGDSPKLVKGINRMDMSAFTSIGKPLTAKFLGEFIAQKFFRSSMIRGEYSKLKNRGTNLKCDRVLIFDESKLALPSGMEKENFYNPMNRLVTEGRKYGLALVLASQRLNHYSEEILTNVNTKILLGAKSNDFKNVARVFATKEDIIKNTFSYKNKRTALIEVNGECDVYEIVNFLSNEILESKLH